MNAASHRGRLSIYIYIYVYTLWFDIYSVINISYPLLATLWWVQRQAKGHEWVTNPSVTPPPLPFLPFPQNALLRPPIHPQALKPKRSL